jgi:NTP pyrophosphatase (non-canonical NTP hydrolase)
MDINYGIGEQNNMDKRLQQIAESYGYDAQSRQCIEEMAELTQAINKFWRKDLDSGEKIFFKVPVNSQQKENIVEEIADVEICLEQIKYLLDCSEQVEKSKEMKIKRQLKRIEREDNV